VEIRRAAEQFVTERDGISTLHCLSFGDHYDPDRVAVGPLVALNDERVGPGAGYATHPHRDVDIVTWVMDGVVHHESSLGVSATIRPGTTQRLTAGTGVTHSEVNASGVEPLRFLQLWFAIEDDVSPSYESWTLPGAEVSGWSVIADEHGGAGRASLVAAGVSVLVGRLPAGELAALPGPGDLFVYVAAGELELSATGEVIHEGDSVRSVGVAPELAARSDSTLLAVRISPAGRGR
jgi:redox-sensitive bicupin YhaK (pirin superfamily)